MIEVKDEHPEKAPFPIDLMEFGMVIEVKEKHHAKALLPID